MTATPGGRLDLEVYALPSHLLVPGATPSPDSAPVAIVLDVVRATSAMVGLFERGAARIHAARDLASGRWLVERDPGRYVDFGEDVSGRRAPGFTWSTSPTEHAAAPGAGREVVFCTVNGTGCIHAAVAAGARRVLLGSFRNASAVAARAADLAVAQGAPVVIVGSGRFANRTAALEDVYCGGYLGRLVTERLVAAGRAPRVSDSFRIAEALSRIYSNRLEALYDGGSGRALLANGAPPSDFEFCAALDTTDVVPEVHLRGEPPSHPVDLIEVEGGDGDGAAPGVPVSAERRLR